MKVIDYRSSFTINITADEEGDNNTCRTQLLAKCALTNDESGQSGEYFLGKDCIGEYMYKERGIAQEQTANVGVIFGEKESSLFKKFANHESDVIQTGEQGVKKKTFAGTIAYSKELKFKLKEAEGRPLKTSEEIIRATLECEPMVGRTMLNDEEGSWHADLEYPLYYMNVHPPEGRFQVDLGPILYPDFDVKGESPIECLKLAYVMYNQLDAVEFAIRVPTPVVEGQSAETLHYSKVIKVAAQSELFSLAV